MGAAVIENREGIIVSGCDIPSEKRLFWAKKKASAHTKIRNLRHKVIRPLVNFRDINGVVHRLAGHPDAWRKTQSTHVAVEIWKGYRLYFSKSLAVGYGVLQGMREENIQYLFSVPKTKKVTGGNGRFSGHRNLDKPTNRATRISDQFSNVWKVAEPGREARQKSGSLFEV